VADDHSDPAPRDAGVPIDDEGRSVGLLLSTLVADYGLLQDRLRAHLGSHELAAEALHDAQFSA
jgi:hypothetical protein